MKETLTFLKSIILKNNKFIYGNLKIKKEEIKKKS